MSIQVHNIQGEDRNVIVEPEIRARFRHVAPGEVAPRHTHDLGHETFLVLQGRIGIEIDGESVTLGPGDLVFARRDQHHQVRNVGDTPAIMFLTVTPHVEPTHTYWNEDGTKRSPLYGGALRGRPEASAVASASSTEQLGDDLLRESQMASAAFATLVERQSFELGRIRDALGLGDSVAAKASVDAIWETMRSALLQVGQLEWVWNTFSPRFSA